MTKKIKYQKYLSVKYTAPCVGTLNVMGLSKNIPTPKIPAGEWKDWDRACPSNSAPIPGLGHHVSGALNGHWCQPEVANMVPSREPHEMLNKWDKLYSNPVLRAVGHALNH